MPSASGRCDRPSAWAWLPVILALIATFIASSIPGSAIPPIGVWNADKILHGIVYAVIGALFMRPLGRTAWGLSHPRLALLCAVGLASAWGFLDEVHQLFTPGRSSDWRDWVADTLGAAVGALVYLATTRAVGRRGRGAPEGVAP